MAHTKPNADDYSNASFMPLSAKPATDLARDIGRKLDAVLFPACDSQQSTRGRPRNIERHQAALLAIVADLIDTARTDKLRWAYRSLNRNDFNDCRVPYRSFREIADALKKASMVEYSRGFHARLPLKFSDDSGFARPRASRWRATPELLVFCERLGLSPQNCSKHFVWKLPLTPLVLKAPSKRNGSNKIQGRRVKLPRNSITQQLMGEVEEINRFLRQSEIKNGTHRGFNRIFNDAVDPETYGWNKGGRLYSVGDDHYQQLPKKERRKLLINAQKVVEIDVKASHLTILYARAGVTLPAGDPYKIPRLPRDIVKQWFLLAFGLGKFPAKWPRKVSAEFAEANQGKRLGRAFPIAKVGDACRKHYGEVLDYWESSGLNSLDFQFLESQAIVDTILTLIREHNIPSLPVHDSLIVRVEDEEIARGTLSLCYERRIGVSPKLETNKQTAKKRK